MVNCYYRGEGWGKSLRHSNGVIPSRLSDRAAAAIVPRLPLSLSPPSPLPELPLVLLPACHGARICLETSRCLSRCRSPSQGGSSRIQLDPRHRVSRARRLCTTTGTCKEGVIQLDPVRSS